MCAPVASELLSYVSEIEHCPYSPPLFNCDKGFTAPLPPPSSPPWKPTQEERSWPIVGSFTSFFLFSSPFPNGKRLASFYALANRENNYELVKLGLSKMMFKMSAGWLCAVKLQYYSHSFFSRLNVVFPCLLKYF